MKKYIQTIFLFLFLFSSGLFAQYATVPLQHQVYPFLDKAETLGIISGYELRVLPLYRATAFELLQKIKPQKNQLSRADQALLVQMLAEFDDPAPSESAPKIGERHLYRYTEDQIQIFLDAEARQEFTFQRNDLDFDEETISRTTGGGRIRGRFSDNISFGLHAHNTMILGEEAEEQFDVGSGQIKVRVGESSFTDQATGYISARLGKFHLLVGRDYYTWGAGISDRLAIGFANEPMDMLRLEFNLKKFRFSYFHGNLSGVGEQRFVAGHRIDALLFGSVDLGLFETLVYGNRNREWGYLNPILPYHVMEHQLGDLDNNMLGGDISVRIRPGLRWFTELFIDDLSTDFPLGTYWGNKLALQSGLHWASPFRIREIEVFTTYTRIDPWVYTHHDTINVYSHYGESFGSRLGPNADRSQFRLVYQPHRDSRWEAGVSYIRKGLGDVNVSHEEEDSKAKGFLAGTVANSLEMSLALRQQVLKDIFVGFEINVQKWQHFARTEGNDGLERFGRFYLWVNY